jgi:transposase
VLLCGHGKPGGSKTRFSEVGRTAAVRGAVVAPRSTSGRSGAAGGVHRQSVSRWAEQLKPRWCTGFEEGRARRAQSARRPEDLRRIERGTEARAASVGLRNQSVDRVARGALDRAGMRGEVHPSQAWRILRQLGWSCQRPVGRALERDEDKIRRWKQQRWPEIKKKPKKKGAPSSSSTKAD